MAEAELVVTGDWNGVAVHISNDPLPRGFQLAPWRSRQLAKGVEAQLWSDAFPLQSAQQISAYYQRWGITLGPSGPVAAWMREAALETERQANFSQLPCRLDCVFGFPAYADAIRFGCHHRRSAPTFLSELRPSTPVLLADMRIWDECNWDFAKPAEALATLQAMASAYWRSVTAVTDRAALVATRVPELLIMPPCPTCSDPLAFNANP